MNLAKKNLDNKYPERTFFMHTDVLPSESMEKGEDLIYSLIAVSFTHKKNGIEEIKQFKDYRTKKRKIKAAQQINDYIKKDLFANLRVVGCLAKGSDLKRNGYTLLRKIPKSKIEINSSHCILPEGKIPIKLAEFIAWYAMCISNLSIHLACWASQVNAKRAEFIIDPIAGDTPGLSTTKMRLMEILTEHTELKKYWKMSRKDNKLQSVGFSYSLIQENEEDKPSHKPIKNMDFSILSDWFAQSSFAASNSEVYLEKWTEEERKEIVAPIFTLKEKGHLRLINMGIPIIFE